MCWVDRRLGLYRMIKSQQVLGLRCSEDRLSKSSRKTGHHHIRFEVIRKGHSISLQPQLYHFVTLSTPRFSTALSLDTPSSLFITQVFNFSRGREATAKYPS